MISSFNQASEGVLNKKDIYFLRANFIFFLSFLCLCLDIFFLRHFTTLPTRSPPSETSFNVQANSRLEKEP